MSTRSTTVVRNTYEKDLAQYWDDKQNDDVNLLLGEKDGLYHHHYGVGDYDPAILSAPADQREPRMIEEMHRLETDEVTFILDAMGDVAPDDRVMDAGSGRGSTSFMVNERFGCNVDGLNISQYQIDFSTKLAHDRGCADKVRFHYQNMTASEFPDGHFQRIVSNETTMYEDLFELFGEFARLLSTGGRYVVMTWCRNDAVNDTSPAVQAIDEHYLCHIHRRSTYFKAMAHHGLVPCHVLDLTREAIPYWDLRNHSELRTGIEDPFLSAYRANDLNYLLIAADRLPR
ncbi:methyltransferase domain-containing protein [Actinomycetes bacterium KLBMP 9759]